ncbi:MAG: reverse transcriptase domain-containing protein [Candidatus Saccharimonadales bacterium]
MSYQVPLEDLLAAYYRCRKSKRGTINALDFEYNYESNLIKLQEELNDGSYIPGRSIAFISNKPVKREIFAADFRDRVVQHLVMDQLEETLENQFIYDSYACRKGKGALFGIKRLDKFIRKCSLNYSQNAYVLKLDIQGFFMHINKDILMGQLRPLVDEKLGGGDYREFIIDLLEKMIYSDPTQGCIIKGRYGDWQGLPRNKSLFYSSPRCGLPIGNLNSQVLANLYLNELDQYIKHDLRLKYYGRYVDDFVIVHQDKDYLLSLIPQINQFLAEELGLKLHPNKTYLQHYSHGVPFLGAVIKPNRLYIGNRAKGNLYSLTIKHSEPEFSFDDDSLQDFISSANSYLGLFKHFNTYELRQKMTKQLLTKHKRRLYVDKDITKFIKKNKKKKK